MLDDFFALSQAERYPYVILIGLAAGLLFGILTAQESLRRKPIHGGTLAQLFHYLGSSTVSSILPAVIIGLLSGLHILQLISMGLIFMGSTVTCMLLYGFFESQAGYVEVKPQRELD